MSGGNTREIFNYRERLVSDDFNRAQRFLARDRAERERMQMNDSPRFGFERGSARLLANLPTTIEAPLRADIYEGICVIPVQGSWSLYVTPGVVGMHDPDGETGSSDPAAPNPDDSSYKIVSDPGISALGVLEIVANVLPFTRIDVIEVQRLETVVETDNRDIYNPATRLFTPAIVDKVSTGRLNYRVRQGVPGGGLPACVQGWLPIAVARVPSSATSTDGCDFWDVRPVVRDRPFSPTRDFNSTYAGQLGNHLLTVDTYSVPGQAKISGVSDADAKWHRAGGLIARGVPGADELFIDAIAADHHEPGFALAARQIWYLWFVFPLGLPRWVRYLTTPDDGIRYPYGPKGIPVISTKGPSGITHSLISPFAPISTPLSTDLQTTCTVGVCAGAWGSSAGGNIKGGLCDGQWTSLPLDGAIPLLPFAGAGSLTTTDWRFTAGTHFPDNARALRLVFLCQITGVLDRHFSFDLTVHVHRQGTTDELAYLHGPGGSQAIVTSPVSHYFQIEIPRPHALGTFDVRVDYNIGGGPVGAKQLETAFVTGWRLGQ